MNVREIVMSLSFTLGVQVRRRRLQGEKIHEGAASGVAMATKDCLMGRWPSELARAQSMT